LNSTKAKKTTTRFLSQQEFEVKFVSN